MCDKQDIITNVRVTHNGTVKKCTFRTVKTGQIGAGWQVGRVAGWQGGRVAGWSGRNLLFQLWNVRTSKNQANV